MEENIDGLVKYKFLKQKKNGMPLSLLGMASVAFTPKEDAKKIISIVNSWEGSDGLDKLKSFYSSILKYHHPEYFMMIKGL